MIAVAALLAAGVGAGGSGRVDAAPVAASAFVPIAPYRLVDSRQGVGTVRAPIAAGTARDIQITGAVVPGNAVAVLANVTATNTLSGGWLQVFPTGRASIGSSSTLNLDAGGVTLPNSTFAPLGDGGQVTVYSTFTTDVIIDVSGFFVPAETSTSGRFVSVAPTRILDTRSRLGWTPPSPGDTKDCDSFPTREAAQEWFDAYIDLYGDVALLDLDGDRIACEPSDRPVTPPVTPPPVAPPGNPGDVKNCSDFGSYAEAKAWFDTYFPFYGDVAKLDGDGNGLPCESLPGGPKALTRPNGKVLGGATITLQVTGRGGIPTSEVSAVVLNVTAVDPTSEGWVQVAPTPVQVGASSNLNTTRGVTTANLVVVPIDAAGRVDLYSTTGGDLLADVFGYFTDATAKDTRTGLFVPMTPTRVLDTRKETVNRGVGAGVAVGFDLSQQLATASAFAGNLTSTNSTAGGYLQLSQHPVTVGAHSNLNTAYSGQTVANAVVSPVALYEPRKIYQVYTLYNADILLDLTGYFTAT